MSLSVGIVSREYPPFFGGGIGTYTEGFSRVLARAGHRVVVITVSNDGTERRDVLDGVNVVRLPFLNGEDWSRPHENIATDETEAAFRSFSPVGVFSMQVAKALPLLVDEYGLQVVEAPETGAPAWFALNARRLGRSCGRRKWPAFLTHLHSPTEWIERWDRAPQRGRAHAELKRMERDVVRWADGVTCPSQSLAAWAETRFELTRGMIQVVPHALGDLERVEQRIATKDQGTRRVLFAGRLEPRKGVDVLLAGFARAVERGADLRLGLAGRDVFDVRTAHPFGACCLERLVPPPIRDRVTLHGPVPPPALSALRRAADFAAAPAASDNFPYSCMEAMAAGLPVVAARAGGMAEMITGRGDGLLFEPGDVDGCAAALERAARMSGAELEEMGRTARDRVRSICDTQSVVRSRVAHLERVIKRADRATPPRRDDEVVIVGATEAYQAAPLEDAVRAGAGFAHGWVRAGDKVRVFGTPTLEGLAIGPRGIGPLAVARPALERVRPGVDWQSPWELAAALAEAGEEGAVVPDCLLQGTSDGSAAAWRHATGDDAVRLCMELGPAMVAALAAERETRPARANETAAGGWRDRAAEAEEELARIKGSRGWRWLSRVYAVLHVLKGRGRTGDRGPA